MEEEEVGEWRRKEREEEDLGKWRRKEVGEWKRKRQGSKGEGIGRDWEKEGGRSVKRWGSEGEGGGKRREIEVIPKSRATPRGR